MSGFDPKQPITHFDDTATQGFERPGDNVIDVWPGDCHHCLQPYTRKGGSVKVYTSNGIEYWCAVCTDEGIQKGTCIKFRALDKKQRKQLRKYDKQQSKSAH